MTRGNKLPKTGDRDVRSRHQLAVLVAPALSMDASVRLM